MSVSWLHKGGRLGSRLTWRRGGQTPLGDRTTRWQTHNSARPASGTKRCCRRSPRRPVVLHRVGDISLPFAAGWLWEWAATQEACPTLPHGNRTFTPEASHSERTATVIIVTIPVGFRIREDQSMVPSLSRLRAHSCHIAAKTLVVLTLALTAMPAL